MTQRPVVIAVDFSPASLIAARWAAAHLTERGALVAVYSVDLPEPPAFLAPMLAPTAPTREAAADGARTRFAALAREIPSVSGEVRVGPASTRVLEVAKEQGASAIVVGPHGARAGLGRLIGSTAERIVRGATCPIVVARGALDRAPVRVMVAVDDSASGRAALEWAARFAEVQGRELVALHVVDPMFSGAVAIGAAPFERRDALRHLGEAAERWLDLQRDSAGLGRERCIGVVRFGDPVAEILAASVAHEIDVLVVGRGRTGLLSGIGSVAAAVVRSASMVTVVVP